MRAGIVIRALASGVFAMALVAVPWGATAQPVPVPATLAGCTYFDAAVLPAGDLLATACFDSGPWLWDLEHGPLGPIDPTLEASFSLAVSPDGAVLAVRSINADVVLLDGSTFELLQRLDLPGGGGTAMAWAPDGSALATGSMWGVLRHWTPDGATVRWRTSRHTGGLAAAAISPDGRWTVSTDGTVRVWSSTDGTPAHTLLRRGDDWAGITPDGRYTAASPDTALLRYWVGGQSQPASAFPELFQADGLSP